MQFQKKPNLLRSSIVFFFIFTAQMLFSQEVLRGEIDVEIEPIYAINLGVKSPLSNADAILWALQDAVTAFSAMIYGWSFEYIPANRERGIRETLDLNLTNEIDFGDEKMKITDAHIEGDIFITWFDYELDSVQKARIASYKSSPTFGVNAQGFAPLFGEDGIKDRRDIKKAALEDAAKKAIREKLRLLYKNRPHKVKGFLSLSKFPLFKMNSGRWSSVASFRLKVLDVENYTAF
ncbi:MAG: hypothetical protein Ta2G_02570 [Termitinemataceae bacterium]|nr:MAG: hypothetical protein Ta2G_02570 [Termitinemataceae bacterium]